MQPTTKVIPFNYSLMIGKGIVAEFECRVEVYQGRDGYPESVERVEVYTLEPGKGYVLHDLDKLEPEGLRPILQAAAQAAIEREYDLKPQAAE